MGSIKMFVWDPRNQRDYYNTACNIYLRGLFESIKNKPQIFYLDQNIVPFENVCRYLTSKTVNIWDFHKHKVFNHFTSYGPCDWDSNIKHDVDVDAIGFTITDFDIATEDDKLGISSGCGKCGLRYGGGFSFSGLAYNTGLASDDPIDYDGYVKTYDLNQCKCEDFQTLNCQELDDFPWYEIRCEVPDTNIMLMRHCSLFNIGFCDLPMETIYNPAVTACD